MDRPDYYPTSDFNGTVRAARAGGEGAAVTDDGEPADARVAIRLTMDDGWVIEIAAEPPGYEEDE